jgi:CubicO group peptidase (beta-lactamase class C family)
VTNSTDASAQAAPSGVVEGTAAPGFERVRDAFSANFTQHGDKGGSFALYVDGELKVDLWGGTADIATGKPWTQDTVSLMYSATKGATAILGSLLAQEGLIDLDAPVAQYWPEFAANGKEHVPVRYFFTHQTGLPYLAEKISREEIIDGRRIVEVLQDQKPLWEPGSAFGYHALTYGWLIGAVVKKATGQSVGQLLQEKVAAPLGLDLWIGLPDGVQDRVAALVDAPPPDPAAMAAITDEAILDRLRALGAAMADPTSTFSRTLSSNGALPTPNAEAWNDPRIWASEMPAANGITNGRALAKMYAATLGEVDGVRLLSEQTLAAATREQVSGTDAVLLSPARFATGFALPRQGLAMLSPASFGHQGAGGALGFADKDAKVAFGYVQNQLGGGPLGDPRTLGLIAAVRDAL